MGVERLEQDEWFYRRARLTFRPSCPVEAVRVGRFAPYVGEDLSRVGVDGDERRGQLGAA